MNGKEWRCLDEKGEELGVVYGKSINEAKLSLMYCQLPPSDFGSKTVYWLVESTGRRYRVG